MHGAKSNSCDQSQNAGNRDVVTQLLIREFADKDWNQFIKYELHLISNDMLLPQLPDK